MEYKLFTIAVTVQKHSLAYEVFINNLQTKSTTVMYQNSLEFNAHPHVRNWSIN